MSYAHAFDSSSNNNNMAGQQQTLYYGQSLANDDMIQHLNDLKKVEEELMLGQTLDLPSLNDHRTEALKEKSSWQEPVANELNMFSNPANNNNNSNGGNASTDADGPHTDDSLDLTSTLEVGAGLKFQKMGALLPNGQEGLGITGIEESPLNAAAVTPPSRMEREKGKARPRASSMPAQFVTTNSSTT